MTRPFKIPRLPYNTAPGGYGGHWLYLLPNEAKRLLASGHVFMPREGTPESAAHKEWDQGGA